MARIATTSTTKKFKSVEDEKTLRNILTRENNITLQEKSLYNNTEIIEYGYKINFESPWSTHIKSILKNSNITNVSRIEKTHRVTKKTGKNEEGF